MSIVRHPNHLFVPLAFTGVALTWIAPRALRPARNAALASALVGATLLLLLQPIEYSRERIGLWRPAQTISCYSPRLQDTVDYDSAIAQIFAHVADGKDILSIGNLFSAQSSVGQRLPQRFTYQFVDRSWATAVGADTVQLGYVEERTFEFVWVHIADLQAREDIDAQLLRDRVTRYGDPELAEALTRSYHPALACMNHVLYEED